MEERIRANVRLVKAAHRLSDDKIAELGGFTGRQVVQSRLAGRSTFDLEDVVRLAAALRVEPWVLMLPRIEALQWLEDHPDYKPPRMPKQKRQRARRFNGDRFVGKAK
jgi:hypothetical protein